MGCRIVLWLGAIMFAWMGVYLAIAPQVLEAWVGIRAVDATGRIELRSFYGGLEMGLALFLALCAVRRTWTMAGCVALASTSLGIAGVRVASIAMEGGASPFLWIALAIEVGLGCTAVAAARSLAKTA